MSEEELENNGINGMIECDGCNMISVYVDENNNLIVSQKLLNKNTEYFNFFDSN